MSCFVMKPASIRKIAYTLDSVFNGYIYSNSYTITAAAIDAAGGMGTNFYCVRLPSGSIGEVFQDCRTPSGDYDGEMIARALWEINVKAYNGRYHEEGGEELPPDLVGLPNIRRAYSLMKTPVHADHREAPQPWHYHLCKLLDCWLYQTNEEATANDAKRQALKAFSNGLKIAIVQHSEDYNHLRWGE